MEMEQHQIRLIRSRRKSIALEIRPEGLIVRAPYRMPEAEIRRFLEKQRAWIDEKLAKLDLARTQAESAGHLSPEELRALADRALSYIPERVKYYAPLVGVTYGRITIRNQRTRWGSCSAQGNLNFNCLLMLTPPEVIDSVVVHELCHRKELNHSKRFYAEVLRVFPDYWKWTAWLKENGRALLLRME